MPPAPMIPTLNRFAIMYLRVVSVVRARDGAARRGALVGHGHQLGEVARRAQVGLVGGPGRDVLDELLERRRAVLAGQLLIAEPAVFPQLERVAGVAVEQARAVPV